MSGCLLELLELLEPLEPLKPLELEDQLLLAAFSAATELRGRQAAENAKPWVEQVRQARSASVLRTTAGHVSTHGHTGCYDL